MQYIIFVVLFIAGFLTTPPNVLFYDQPEYLRIVSTHSFWQVFSLGHFPIHPIFMSVLWIANKLVSANSIALIFGVISIFIFYKISKLIFKNGPYWLSVVVFALFPAIWLINTNLMVESLALTFYLASLYLFISKRKSLLFCSLFLMIGTHLESIVWIPTIILTPYLFDLKFKKDEVIKYVKLFVMAVLTSLAFYIAIYRLSGRSAGGTTEQLSTYFSSGIFRMIRNVWLSFIRGFGSLTPFVLVYLFFKNIKTKKLLLAWITFFAVVCLISANWQGDFMIRRIIFAAVILSLAIYKYLRKATILFILYLIPIIVANGILYYRSSPNMALSEMQKRIDRLPSSQVLLQSHYYQPFTKYEGEVLWIGNDDLGQIDKYLAMGKKVFITKESVTAPYLLVVGNNYHITSVGKVGDSESRLLFYKYAFEPYNGNLELKLFKGTKISVQTGESVVSYDTSFWGRLVRRRMDYGDVGVWIWAIVTNHRDPSTWTYKDARGIWLQI